ncbi:MAG: PAS domain S-box protein [Dehalococcoidales bacterium]|nr:PAS domain S-box protein [Dehalococcoidales bacterium]
MNIVDRIKNIPATIPHFHLWVVVILFIVGVILHYPQQLLSLDSPSLFSFLGLSRHAVERIFLLLPIGYAGFFFGIRVGLVSLAVATIIMLPRVFLISNFFSDALFETIVIVFIGWMINLWFHSYRSEKEKQRRILSTIEKTHEELQSQAIASERIERQLVTISRISTTVSQSQEMSQILDNAVSSIIGLLRVDAAWIYLLGRDNSGLTLAAYGGNYQDLIRVEAESGINKKVVNTGQPMLVEDVSKETRIVVPLSVKGKPIGTLGVQSKSRRYFDNEEVELLAVIGNQISAATENAMLFQREIEVAEKLRISEQRYRELFESAQDAIWVHDMEGYLTTVNKATETLSGYSLEELIGMNVRTFLTEESLQLAGQIRNKLLDGSTDEQPYEQRLVRKDGTEWILMLTTNLIREDGKLIGFLCIARDVTKEKEMQLQLSKAYQELSESIQQLKNSQQQLIQAEKLTSLGQLAASIAHEVNNPLSGVLIYTQLIAKKIKESKIDNNTTLEYLSKMEFELIRSTKLIKNLLDFARQSSPKFQQANLNMIMNRAYDIASHSAELQHVRVIKELDPALPDITADADQLQQVFTNLILNAIQAMPQGGKLTLRSSASANQIKIEVSDTGIGIPPENMNKLFTPFFTTKLEVKGVGLGLAIAYGIVQRHKGKIEVRSKIGDGTTFTIYLPLHIEIDEK